MCPQVKGHLLTYRPNGRAAIAFPSAMRPQVQAQDASHEVGAMWQCMLFVGRCRVCWRLSRDAFWRTFVDGVRPLHILTTTIEVAAAICTSFWVIIMSNSLALDAFSIWSEDNPQTSDLFGEYHLVRRLKMLLFICFYFRVLRSIPFVLFLVFFCIFSENHKTSESSTLPHSWA